MLRGFFIFGNMNFSSELLKWYKKHKRDLPWRKTTDPYLIWLSEIILQQTRVSQGLPYFLRFKKKYPTIRKFASAKQRDILKLWQGLGYYSRARNMHETAKNIVKYSGGKFPREYSELLRLKGIGEYTAAAITSISFNLPYPVVDGNVVRVLSRYFGIKNNGSTSALRKKYVALARKLMGKHSPSDFNQAMMEFGALQCIPKNPDCSICPLNKSCFAYKNSKVEWLPPRKQKVKIIKRYFDYLLLRNGLNIFLRQRNGNDIWKKLFDFPLIESSKTVSKTELRKIIATNNYISNEDFEIVPIGNVYEHQLSHQLLQVRFWRVKTNRNFINPMSSELLSVDAKTVENYPMPRLIEKFLADHNLFDN